MSRKRNRKRQRNPNQIQQERGNRWFFHYYQYLTMLSYQLFEWHNLPKTIDPKYLEKTLHDFGYVGIYKDKDKGYIATQGALSGMLNHYNLPTEFQASSPMYNKKFKLFNYGDLTKLPISNDKGEIEYIENIDKGVVIYNNELQKSTLPTLEMFAQDLAELKEVIYVNQNAQKTPVVISTNDSTKFSHMQIYNQYEGNAPVIMVHESIDPKSINVFKTDAPYVVDKLHNQKDNVWSEIMTYLSIKNSNIQKKERLLVDEINSNNGQTSSSGHIFLKPRKEACALLNELYNFNPPIDVTFRDETIEKFNQLKDDEIKI